MATLKPLYGFAAVALAGLVVVAQMPRTAMALWLLVLTMVPVWLGLTWQAYLPPATLVGLGLLLGAIRLGRKWATADRWVVAFLSLATGLLLFGIGDQGSWGAIVLQWALGYVVGRVLAGRAGVRWTADCFAWLMVIAAAFGIIEFITHWHAFIGLSGPNAGQNHWAVVQDRGGFARSEWAFGHAIAFGAALVSAIPFIVTARAGRNLRVVGLIILLGGVGTTLSRGPLLASAFTLLLAAFSLTSILSGWHRFRLVLLLGAGAAIAGPLFSQVGSGAASEIDSSTNYRSSLFSLVLRDVHPFGRADGVQITNGSFSYRGFVSIDNAFAAVALVYGWVLIVIPAVGLLLALVWVVRRRGTVADIALAGQIPILLTVALITQYQMLVWFLAGLAVTWAQQARTGVSPVDAPPDQRTVSARETSFQVEPSQ